MNNPGSGAYIQLLLLIVYIIPAVFFLLTQQRTLDLIRPQLRRIPSRQVWIQLIPIVGLAWQFVVIIRISDSIRDELNTPTDDSILDEDFIPENHRPTFNAGISYAALFCTVVAPFPLLQIFAFPAGFVAWIIYWVQLAGYKKRLKERKLLQTDTAR